MASAPKTGDIVGGFRLPGGQLLGEAFRRADYTLHGERGQPLVLAFYPGEDTSVRTAQPCSYSDGLAELESAGATVWGISPQGVDSHERFAAPPWPCTPASSAAPAHRRRPRTACPHSTTATSRGPCRDDARQVFVGGPSNSAEWSRGGVPRRGAWR
ncbi:redoxin domain-containing protein [Streptomyces goshikiensis]|uniref:redoxin domain-containing protein n=1 Tax=Streptomyces goshikiensis TaxID=1942 RepID=UPI00332BEBB6